MNATTPPAVVVAAGGYRSGSTLQYNLVGEYVERAGLGRRLGWVAPDEAESTVAAWIARGTGLGMRPVRERRAAGSGERITRDASPAHGGGVDSRLAPNMVGLK